MRRKENLYFCNLKIRGCSCLAQLVKNLPAMPEIWVKFLSQEDTLEKEMATHSSGFWVPWEICMQVRKQQLELDMEQQTASKSGKKYVKAVYCHLTCLCTSWETLGWRNHKLESRLMGEIAITSDIQMTPPLWQKVKN